MQALAALMAVLYLPLLLERRWLQGQVAESPANKARLRDLLQHRDLGWPQHVANVTGSIHIVFSSTHLTLSCLLGAGSLGEAAQSALSPEH